MPKGIKGFQNGYKPTEQTRLKIGAANGVAEIIDVAEREGFDLAWVRSAVLLGVAGLEIGDIKTKHPVNPKQASCSIREFIEKLSKDKMRRQSHDK